ncbi:MAG: hypothetical protein RSB78_01510 [Oscillospiraceae bacterium]
MDDNMTDKITYLSLYLSENRIKRGSSLNVMFTVKNNAQEKVCANLSIYIQPGESTRGWRIGAQRSCELEAKKIHHIYMNIPAAAFEQDDDDKEDNCREFVVCAGCPEQEKREFRKTRDIVFVIG